MLRLCYFILLSALLLPVVLEKEYPWCAEAEKGLRQIFTEYTRRKADRQILDYDDLLIFWQALLAVPEARDHIGGMFDHVLVDEYQDTNSLQCDIVDLLAAVHKNLSVVGDDAQSIYGFRGAEPRLMQAIIEQAGGVRPEDIQNRSWRSRQENGGCWDRCGCCCWPRPYSASGGGGSESHTTAGGFFIATQRSCSLSLSGFISISSTKPFAGESH